MKSFHSLQAGRGIQRQTWRQTKTQKQAKKVSIPFKREGAFKVYQRGGVGLDILICFNSLQAGRGIQSIYDFSDKISVTKFQFPSSGKGHSKEKEEDLIMFWWSVSIPFKREGAFKASWSNETARRSVCFNSLQAGRGIQRLVAISSSAMFTLTVSIPFKREGAFKVRSNVMVDDIRNKSFNSLQAGRGIQREKL